VSANGSHPRPVVRTLLRHAIDYAGLFPPAQLDMATAVAEYVAYATSPDRWALGRFVVPASRLGELSQVAATLPDGERSLGDARVALSVVLGADVATDMTRVNAFAASPTGNGRWWSSVQAVELRAATVDAIRRSVDVVPDEIERFIEIPVAGDPGPLVRAIGATDGCAKVRTGGTTADAFPPSRDLARFIATCVSENVRFKATAGLHHPLRGDYRLTYEPESATATMYGFLNVFLATALLRAGFGESLARDALDEQDPASIRFDDKGIAWREHRLSAAELGDARGLAVRSFGSCSFREPIDDLTALGIL
jgi:hypothetical protein